MKNGVEKAEKLYAGLSGVREEYLAEMERTQTRPRARRKLTVTLIAAALAAAMLTLGVAAAAGSGGIAGFFTGAWRELTGREPGEGHRALLQSLCQSVGLSRTVNGVTVTVDSAAAGERSFAVLIRVEGVDDAPVNEKLYTSEFRFRQVAEITGAPTRVFATGNYFLGREEDGSLLFLEIGDALQEIFTEENGGTVHVSLTLGDLVHDRTPQGITVSRDEEVVHDIVTAAEGEWSFEFDIKYSEACRSVALGDVEVEREGGAAVRVTEITFTCMEIRFTTDGRFDGEVAAVLTDGTEIGRAEGMGQGREDGGWSCCFRWLLPVDPDDVAAIRFGDTLIPMP